MNVWEVQLLTIAHSLIVSCRCRPRVVVEVEIIESRGYLNKIINLKSPLNLNVSCLKHTSVLKTLKCVTNRMITQEGNCLKPCTWWGRMLIKLYIVFHNVELLISYHNRFRLRKFGTIAVCQPINYPNRNVSSPISSASGRIPSGTVRFCMSDIRFINLENSLNH